MAVEKISPEAETLASNVQSVDAEATAQKASQVADQASNAAEQASAKAADAAQDAKALLDKTNKELGKIPQTIEEKLDESIAALEKALGWSPTIEKIKIKQPDGTEIEVPDFDPSKILDDLTKVIDPVLAAIGPVESVAGKIPVIGDLTGLLTTLGTDKSGESSISKEEVLAMVPNAPDVPPTIYKKIGRLMQLIGQFVQELPIILIDVIFQMLAAIYDMFDQIVGIIGVPPAIFPFSLIKDIVKLPPKIKTLISQMPSQADTLVTEKIKQKFQYAMALSVPKPNLSAPGASSLKTAASSVSSAASSTASGSATSSTSETSKQEVVPPTQSQPPPVESNIPETPSIPEAEPKAPIAPDTKPEYKYFSLYFKLGYDDFCKASGQPDWTDENLNIFEKLKDVGLKTQKDIGFENVVCNADTYRGTYEIKTRIPNDSQYNSVESVGKYYDKCVKELNESDIIELKLFNEKYSLVGNCVMSYYVLKKSKFLGLF